MFFTKNDSRILKLLSLVSLPLEVIAFRFFLRLPLDVERNVAPGFFESIADGVVGVMHVPALVVLDRAVPDRDLLKLALFFVGYLELVLVSVVIIALHRLMRRVRA